MRDPRADAEGKGVETGQHAASLNGGVSSVLHGNRTYLLQDEDGQIIDVHSISARLDYPDIDPEQAWLYERERINYVSITDKEALEAFQLCCRREGIIPALESAHALAQVAKLAPTSQHVERAVGQLREHTHLPIAVSFGIRNAEQAVRLAVSAMLVVVGSALVECVERAELGSGINYDKPADYRAFN